jgi:hypothetical protein
VTDKVFQHRDSEDSEMRISPRKLLGEQFAETDQIIHRDEGAEQLLARQKRTLFKMSKGLPHGHRKSPQT